MKEKFFFSGAVVCALFFCNPCSFGKYIKSNGWERALLLKYVREPRAAHASVNKNGNLFAACIPQGGQILDYEPERIFHIQGEAPLRANSSNKKYSVFHIASPVNGDLKTIRRSQVQANGAGNEIYYDSESSLLTATDDAGKGYLFYIFDGYSTKGDKSLLSTKPLNKDNGLMNLQIAGLDGTSWADGFRPGLFNDTSWLETGVGGNDPLVKYCHHRQTCLTWGSQDRFGINFVAGALEDSWACAICGYYWWNWRQNDDVNTSINPFVGNGEPREQPFPQQDYYGLLMGSGEKVERSWRKDKKWFEFGDDAVSTYYKPNVIAKDREFGPRRTLDGRTYKNNELTVLYLRHFSRMQFPSNQNLVYAEYNRYAGVPAVHLYTAQFNHPSDSKQKGIYGGHHHPITSFFGKKVANGSIDLCWYDNNAFVISLDESAKETVIVRVAINLEEQGALKLLTFPIETVKIASIPWSKTKDAKGEEVLLRPENVFIQVHNNYLFTAWNTSREVLLAFALLSGQKKMVEVDKKMISTQSYSLYTPLVLQELAIKEDTTGALSLRSFDIQNNQVHLTYLEGQDYYYLRNDLSRLVPEFTLSK